MNTSRKGLRQVFLVEKLGLQGLTSGPHALKARPDLRSVQMLDLFGRQYLPYNYDYTACKINVARIERTDSSSEMSSYCKSIGYF